MVYTFITISISRLLLKYNLTKTLINFNKKLYIQKFRHFSNMLVSKNAKIYEYIYVIAYVNSST